MFAFRAGIIDSAAINGGIVHDEQDAYALVLTGHNEVPPPLSQSTGNSPTSFGYIVRDGAKNPGIWKLIAPGQSRRPVEDRGIRILRIHGSGGGGFWTPEAGIRYDGLHAITHYSFQMKPGMNLLDLGENNRFRSEFVVYFTRIDEPGENLADIYSRPWADDLDDYVRYKAASIKAKETYRISRRKARAEAIMDDLYGIARGSKRKKLTKLLGEEVGTREYGTNVHEDRNSA